MPTGRKALYAMFVDMFIQQGWPQLAAEIPIESSLSARWYSILARAVRMDSIAGNCVITCFRRRCSARSFQYAGIVPLESAPARAQMRGANVACG